MANVHHLSFIVMYITFCSLGSRSSSHCRSSHSSDARRSMDSYRGTFVPIVDESASESRRKDDTVAIIASGRLNLGSMTSDYGTVNRSK
jgi:hypothetical protein